MAANSGKLRPGDSFKDLNKEFEKFVGRKWKSGKKGFDINKWEQEVRAKSGQEALGVKLESNGEGVVEDIGSSPDTKTSPESESPAQEDNPVAPEAKQGDSGQQISHSAQDEGSSEPTPSQPSSDSVVESGSSDGEQWPEVKPATSQEAEVSAELARMPEADQEKLRVGLENFGYFVEAKKNAGMARLAEFCFRRLNKKSAMGRWMQSLGEGFRKSEEKAVESMQSNPDTVKGKLGKTALSQLKLGVNILRYGRIVADFAGYTALAPFRYVMLGSMAFSKGSEAAKEARFKNEQVKERTRIQILMKRLKWRGLCMQKPRNRFLALNHQKKRS